VSIFSRPPDISSTLFAQFRNIVWKRSLPAHPDWTFHVTVCCGWAALVAGAPIPGVADAVAVVGAFCERHAVARDARPLTDAYLRRLRLSRLGNPTSTTSLAGVRAMRVPALPPVK